MTDLEMTKLCAEAMGYKTHKHSEKMYYDEENRHSLLKERWDPLHDDAQAMALVKAIPLHLECPIHGGSPEWWAHTEADDDGDIYGASSKDLNRAIVECVAKIQSSRPS